MTNINRRGRPKLINADRKHKLLSIRLQPSEHSEFEKKAKAEGLSLSDWVRKKLQTDLQCDNYKDGSGPQES